MKKTLLTIAAVATISTSAQAMDAVSQAKMKDWVETITPMLVLAEACDSPNYLDLYKTAYKVAHVAAGVEEGDMWSSIIDMEFNMAPLETSGDVKKLARMLKAKAKGYQKWCSDAEKDIVKTINNLES